MAMMRIGMGAAGETAVTGPPPPAPMGKLDQLVGGAKTWMSPGEIPDTLKAVFSPDAWKAAPMALIGFLLVPAAVLAVVLGMGAAKRRRAKNPRRKRAVARRSRRRADNPRRRTAKKAYRIGTQSRMPAGSNIWDWLPSLDPHTTYATKAAAVKAAKRASLGKDVEGFKPRWTAHPVTGHAR